MISQSPVSPLAVDGTNGKLSEELVQRLLHVNKTTDNETVTLPVTHYQFLAWPDHGVPSSTALAPLYLLQYIRQTKKPIVVHCSAGVGRTGSVVAIEYVLESVLFNQRCEDLAEIVRDLRTQRACCVQTESQYFYVHWILLRFYTEHRYIAADDPRLVKFLADYEQATAKRP
ncbi:hypothetical protein L596_027671 [Steinernema carpocapsae]|uniref:Tyrosine-protein phosphatase domain-containing protein n=1 Tax=Steinernema carpocapsae TaxID=34508 RepID=A0A4U5LW77_STECR|nr:hypothetical protein L596_027671 [Steinernema carpocapsae]